jgi:hypothetical protein
MPHIHLIVALVCHILMSDASIFDIFQRLRHASLCGTPRISVATRLYNACSCSFNICFAPVFRSIMGIFSATRLSHVYFLFQDRLLYAALNITNNRLHRTEEWI